MDTNNENYDVNNSVAENDQIKGIQSRTGDDITNSGEVSYGENTSIGNEDYQEDGGEDLGFGEPGIDEGEDRENPLRRSAPGGGTSDGTNEGNWSGGKGNSGGNIGKLSGEYDTNSSSAGGSGTMRK